MRRLVLSHLLCTATLLLWLTLAGAGVARAAGPDLVVSALAAPATADPGDIVAVQETTKNQGDAAAGTSTTLVCIARDAALTDRVVSKSLTHSALAAGATEMKSTGPLTLPGDLSPGAYYVGAIADVNAVVAESNETNNIRTQQILVSPGPDLVVTGMSAPDTGLQGAAFQVSETTTNQGTEDAGSSTTRMCLATDAALTDIVSSTDFAHTPLAAGAYATRRGAITVPSDLPSGTYWVGAIADVTGAVAEVNEGNNKTSRSIYIGGTIDLLVTALSAPGGVLQGQNLSVTETTKNEGTGSCGASTTRVCLATDAALTDIVASADVAHAGIAAGASDQKSGSIAVPAGLPSGDYYVGAIADVAGVITETDETNNKRSQLIYVGGLPDLVVSALTAPDLVMQGANLSVSETTKNQGTEDATASTTRICLARDAALADQIVSADLSHAALAVGATEQKDGQLAVPADLTSGFYYVGAIADQPAAIRETDETNNKSTRLIIVGGAPDLTVPALSAPGSALPGQSLNVTETTKNVGTGGAAASTTRLVLARNATLTDVVAQANVTHEAIAAGAEQQKSGTVAIPSGLATGSYYIGAIADAAGVVTELNENNNKSSQPILIMPVRWSAVWHFDEGTGATAHDSSGSGNNGSLLPADAGPTWTEDDAKHSDDGYALLFDGSNDLVETKDIDLPDTVLVRARVKPAGVTGLQQVIVSKWKGGCGGNYELLLREDLKPAFRMSFGTGECGTEYAMTSTTALVPGQWYCLAGVYDGETIKLYVDNLAPSSWPVGLEPVVNDLKTTIGRVADKGTDSGSRWFTGAIDEVYLGDELPSFVDVPPTFWSFDETEGCAAAEIVQGYPVSDPYHPGTTLYYYQPSWGVTRDQMAVYIARAVAGGEDNVPAASAYPTPTFSDVASDHWAYRHIEYDFDEGIVTGYDAQHYAPGDPVDRGQMAVFIARAREWVKIGDNMATAPQLFPDVPAGFWSGTAVKACVDNGVVRGYDDGLYHPEVQVSRDQMAVYIAKAFELPL
ncbi:MAG: CARDB domain-containing protein [Armatimonadota bacterium]